MKARLTLPLESIDPVQLRVKPDRRQRLDRRLVPRGGRRAGDDQRARLWHLGETSGVPPGPRMEWRLVAAVEDAVIVREDPLSGSRFTVHVSGVAPLACATYAEAEAHAASYAERARANVWYVERGRLQFVCSFNSCHRRQETPVSDPHE